MAWKLNGERVLLLGWGSAILLQIAHPLVAAGVAEHSTALANPTTRLRRLQSTVNTMLALTYGTPEEIQRAARVINSIHDRVHGRLPEPTGAFPAGADYTAHDPTLLRWVLATLLYTQTRTYELYVGHLTPEEKDRYCTEASGMAPLLGIPEDYIPRNTAELHEYLDRMLRSGEITITDTARELARQVLLPLPGMPQSLGWPVWLPAIGLLPPSVRHAYGLRWDGRREMALRNSAAVTRRALPLLPPALRYWPAARKAFRRARLAG